jgi:hypothetical protein
MKQIFTGLKLVGAFALLLAGYCGCASTKVQNKESLLSAAGFQRRIPSTQTQLAMYNRMAPYKLERNTINGKALYTYVANIFSALSTSQCRSLSPAKNVQPLFACSRFCSSKNAWAFSKFQNMFCFRLHRSRPPASSLLG